MLIGEGENAPMREEHVTLGEGKLPTAVEMCIMEMKKGILCFSLCLLYSPDLCWPELKWADGRGR